MYNGVVLKDDEFEFIKQSNYIELQYSTEALVDAIYAWNFLRTMEDFNILTLLNCHRILMINIDPTIAGKIRECDVWIDGCYKPFISVQLIENDLIYLLKQILNSKIGPKEAHIQFEYIHPFVDGNGRVGRMLYNLHRLYIGKPIHIIKESEKYDYYKWFQYYLPKTLSNMQNKTYNKNKVDML